MKKDDQAFIETMATQIVLNYVISLLDDDKQRQLKEIVDTLCVSNSPSQERNELEGCIIIRAQELVETGISSTEK